MDNPRLACKEEKILHDNCWMSWYRNEFIVGNATSMPCDSEWEIYRSCMRVNKFTKSFPLKSKLKNSILC